MNNNVMTCTKNNATEDEFKKYCPQWKRIPENWRKKFEADGWKFVFTNDILEFGATSKNMVFSDARAKRIWINLKNATVSQYPVYVGFIFYLQTEYERMDISATFKSCYTGDKKALSKMLNKDISGLLGDEIFERIFIMTLEEPWKVEPYKNYRTCIYVNLWLTMGIFRIRKSVCKDYITIGQYVTEDQIHFVEHTFERLPQKIQDELISEDWKFIVTNAPAWKYKAGHETLNGEIYFDGNKVIVRASYARLKIAFLHEIGHFVYHKITNDNYKIKFESIYQNEKDKYLQQYQDSCAIADSEEYFAQMFAHWVDNFDEVERDYNLSFKYFVIVIRNLFYR